VVDELQNLSLPANTFFFIVVLSSFYRCISVLVIILPVRRPSTRHNVIAGHHCCSGRTAINRKWCWIDEAGTIFSCGVITTNRSNQNAKADEYDIHGSGYRKNRCEVIILSYDPNEEKKTLPYLVVHIVESPTQ